MRVAFCGGGTGGHVYPALTVAAALKRLACRDGMEPRLLYIGVRGKIDRELVVREGVEFRAVTARPLRAGSLLGTLEGGAGLSLGAGQALAVLREFRPDVVFATGGYGSVPPAAAARLLGRPLLLFLPDVEAGLAVRFLARLASRVAVAVEASLAAFPAGKAVVTGYPVRPAFFEADRDTARARLGLHPELPTLLVSGASSGANRLNRAVASWLADFLRLGQVVHLSGATDEAWLRREAERLPGELRERYHLHAYLHEEMALAMAAADIAVMRSGGSTLGELPAVRLPAVLVPGEYEGWDQSANARYLEREGAAVMLPQSRLGELRSTVMELLADGARREGMRSALAGQARPEAAERLAGMVAEMAGARQKESV
jgi:UDP-N-acetylglucosamine--N-acetylmuramyl-(pentapeptide) pyrophosphoryl-undecaprenol N-acetylglucosamine transferase